MKKAIRFIGKVLLEAIAVVLMIILSLSIYRKALLSGDNRQMTEQYSEAQNVYAEDM